MKSCYVCGQPRITADADCDHCSSDGALLSRIEAGAHKHDFLFGRTTQPLARVKDVPAARDHVPIARKKPKPRPKPRTGTSAPLLRDTGLDSSIRQPADDIVLPAIRNRDESLPAWRTAQGPPIYLRAVSYLLDVAVCSLLNYWIFLLVLRVSDRAMGPLLNVSLIPLFFVLLCFTVLYFWLFLSLFQKSLGRLLVDGLAKRFT